MNEGKSSISASIVQEVLENNGENATIPEINEVTNNPDEQAQNNDQNSPTLSTELTGSTLNTAENMKTAEQNQVKGSISTQENQESIREDGSSNTKLLDMINVEEDHSPAVVVHDPFANQVDVPIDNDLVELVSNGKNEPEFLINDENEQQSDREAQSEANKQVLTETMTNETKENDNYLDDFDGETNVEETLFMGEIRDQQTFESVKHIQRYLKEIKESPDAVDQATKLLNFIKFSVIKKKLDLAQISEVLIEYFKTVAFLLSEISIEQLDNFFESFFPEDADELMQLIHHDFSKILEPNQREMWAKHTKDALENVYRNLRQILDNYGQKDNLVAVKDFYIVGQDEPLCSFKAPWNCIVSDDYSATVIPSSYNWPGLSEIPNTMWITNTPTVIKIKDFDPHNPIYKTKQSWQINFPAKSKKSIMDQVIFQANLDEDAAVNLKEVQNLKWQTLILKPDPKRVTGLLTDFAGTMVFIQADKIRSITSEIGVEGGKIFNSDYETTYIDIPPKALRFDISVSMQIETLGNPKKILTAMVEDNKEELLKNFISVSNIVTIQSQSKPLRVPMILSVVLPDENAKKQENVYPGKVSFNLVSGKSETVRESLCRTPYMDPFQRTLDMLRQLIALSQKPSTLTSLVYILELRKFKSPNPAHNRWVVIDQEYEVKENVVHIKFDQIYSAAWMVMRFRIIQDPLMVQKLANKLYLSLRQTVVYIVLKDSNPAESEFQLAIVQENDLKAIKESGTMRDSPVGPLMLNEGEVFDVVFSRNIQLANDNERVNVKNGSFSISFRRYVQNNYPFRVACKDPNGQSYLDHYRGFITLDHPSNAAGRFLRKSLLGVMEVPKVDSPLFLIKLSKKTRDPDLEGNLL